MSYTLDESQVKKFSGLDAGANASASDYLAMVQGGVLKRVTLTQLLAAVPALVFADGTSMTTAGAPGSGVTNTGDVSIASDTDSSGAGDITLASTAVVRLRVKASTGTVVIGEPASVANHLLQVHQKTAGRGLLFSRESLAHGVTGELPTNGVLLLRDANATHGGAFLIGASDGTAAGMTLEAVLGATSPAATIPAIMLKGVKSDGAGNAAALASSELLMQILNRTAKLAAMTGNGFLLLSGNAATAPATRLEIEDSAAQLRLSYTSGALYSDLSVGSNGNLTLTPSGTSVIIAAGKRLRLPTVSDAGPMTATNGTVSEVVYNTADNKVYVCTSTGTPGTWAALN